MGVDMACFMRTWLLFGFLVVVSTHRVSPTFKSAQASPPADTETDCALKKMAYDFGSHMLMKTPLHQLRNASASIYDALQLHECNMTLQDHSFAASSNSIVGDASQRFQDAGARLFWTQA